MKSMTAFLVNYYIITKGTKISIKHVLSHNFCYKLMAGEYSFIKCNTNINKQTKFNLGRFQKKIFFQVEQVFLFVCLNKYIIWSRQPDYFLSMKHIFSKMCIFNTFLTKKVLMIRTFFSLFELHQ